MSKKFRVGERTFFHRASAAESYVSHKVLSNKVGKVKNYSSFNEKFPEHTFNEPFTWNFSSKIGKTSLKNRVDEAKAHSKFNAKSLDLDTIDYVLSSYETKIDSINSRLEKFKAKLLYKPKKIYNLKKKIKIFALPLQFKYF